jgi:hypothetical protein
MEGDSSFQIKHFICVTTRNQTTKITIALTVLNQTDSPVSAYGIRQFRTDDGLNLFALATL